MKTLLYLAIYLNSTVHWLKVWANFARESHAIMASSVIINTDQASFC